VKWGTIEAYAATSGDACESALHGDACKMAEMLVTQHKRIAELEAALMQIKAYAGHTLLGPDSKHHMGDDAPRYHEMGAAAAFEQCAEIASQALAKGGGS